MNFTLKVNLIISSVITLILIILIRTAWVGDDAYITFRTVDNLVNGFGPIWNAAERVQSFTHPLWMFLLAAFYFLTNEIYYTSIIISISVSLKAFVILAFRLATNGLTAVICLLLLLSSKAFIDYSTSGLENALTHLLLVIFFAIFFKGKKNVRTLFCLSLLMSLIATNRMDTILLCLPPLAFYWFDLRQPRAIFYILLGMTPFVVWELFSLFYYGFLFPNTAYAKLNTGIARSDLIRQGLFYLENNLKRSPSTIGAMLGAAVFVVYNKQARYLAPVSGIFLYLAYIVWVGGDFMSGRFLTAPFLVAVILLSQYNFKLSVSKSTVTVAALVLLGLVWSRSAVQTGADYGQGEEARDYVRGVSDERAGYYQYTGMLARRDGVFWPDHKWVAEGKDLKHYADDVRVFGGIGMRGYFAGPEVHLINSHGLSDAFLARLPIINRHRWRIGHFNRSIPLDYIGSLETNSNQIADPSLAEYYDKLNTIIKGPLFSYERLKLIFSFNLGGYNYLLDEYFSRPIPTAFSKVSRVLPQGTQYDDWRCTLLSEQGFTVYLDSLSNSQKLEISLDHNDSYILFFLLDTLQLAEIPISKRYIDERGLRVDTIVVPESAVMSGYNKIIVVPVSGDGFYSLGHIRLF